MQNDFILCECNSAEHQIIINYDDDTWVSCQIHLYNKKFLTRLLNGIKYIFGYKSKYGAWDEFLLGKKDIVVLEKIINHLKK